MQNGEMYINEEISIDGLRIPDATMEYIENIMKAFEAGDVLAWDTLMEPFGGYLKEDFNENLISADTYAKLKERFCVC